MNNSNLGSKQYTLSDDAPQDKLPRFREREGELITILDAIQALQHSPEWSTLKKSVFDGKTEALNKELLSEAKKEIPDPLVLNRLAGELKWAEKFSDVSKLEQHFRLELTQVRKLLYGTTQE